MADTTIIKTEGEGVTETQTELAQDVGKLQAEIEHHAESITGHTTRLESLEGGSEWLRTELNRVSEAIDQAPAIPMESLEGLRSGLEELRQRMEAVEKVKPSTVETALPSAVSTVHKGTKQTEESVLDTLRHLV